MGVLVNLAEFEGPPPSPEELVSRMNQLSELSVQLEDGSLCFRSAPLEKIDVSFRNSGKGEVGLFAQAGQAPALFLLTCHALQQLGGEFRTPLEGLAFPLTLTEAKRIDESKRSALRKLGILFATVLGGLVLLALGVVLVLAWFLYSWPRA